MNKPMTMNNANMENTKSLAYYPGCTLKNTAQNFEKCALFSLRQLGITVTELPRWNCCGTVYSLASDNLIQHVGPVRNLLRAKEIGSSQVMTLCAMCYNTLKRANERIKHDAVALKRINDLMTREPLKYQGDVEVFHLLEWLKNKFTFRQLKEKISKPLTHLRVAAYYGCLLVRPESIGIDDAENPTIMEQLAECLGATAIDFPFKTECCSAYQTVTKPDMTARRTHRILSSAAKQGADIIMVSCPLCAFNLDQRQAQTIELFPDFKPMPIVYFTQLLALALGCSEQTLGLNMHFISPEALLRKNNLM
jgi:heterodisulfide reductase subunit B